MHKHGKMNQAFKLVWSESRGKYIVAPETAKGHSVSSKKVEGARAVLLALAGVILSGFGVGAGAAPPATTVIPDAAASGNTNAYVAPNGVPVVNINTANSSGVSNNVYSTFNVEANGLVLNNWGPNRGNLGTSQLAGALPFNPNLNQEAKVILNQVNSTNPSTLNGFMEVMGGRADVVVANPNGISCSGCGVINTDRFTLTTGTPTLDANGALSSIHVKEGAITVQRAGLDGSRAQQVDLVARRIVLDGGVNASESGSLLLVTGENRWDYQNGTAQNATVQNATVYIPLGRYSSEADYAVDSTAFGGLSAGKIRVTATDSGIGVRMDGNSAATRGTFEINSRGQIEIVGKVAAEQGMSLIGKKVEVGRQGELESNGDVSIRTASGLNSQGKITGLDEVRIFTSGVVENSGTIAAGNLLNVESSSGIVNRREGKLISGEKAQFSTAGNIKNDGQMLAQSVMDIKATRNLIEIQNAVDRAPGDGIINLSSGTLEVVAGDIAAGNVENTGSLTGSIVHVNTSGELKNAGLIVGMNELRVHGANIGNEANGGMYSREDIDLTATTGDIENRGSIYADKRVALEAATGKIANQSTAEAPQGYIGSNGSVSIKAKEFENRSEVSAEGDIHISSEKFLNSVHGDTARVIDSTEADAKPDLLGQNTWYSFPDRYHATYYAKNWTETERLAGGVPLHKPQIISGQNIIIDEFVDAKNIGGVISAEKDVTINARNGSAGTFLNDDLSLKTYSKRATWSHFIHEIGLGPATYVNNPFHEYKDFVAGITNDDSVGAGIYAGRNFNSSGASFSNVGSQYGKDITRALAGVKTVTPGLSDANLASYLPNSANGRFVMSPNQSGAQYMVELHSFYLRDSGLLGSNYLAQSLGMDLNALAKRLGDPHYEAYLVRQQLVAQTGHVLLGGVDAQGNALSEAAQLEKMWTAAAAAQPALQLVWGKPLTETQISQLSENITWMVMENVNGTQVLVPRVYLAPASRAQLSAGAVIEAQNIHISDAVKFENNGGLIKADDISIQAKGDITNASGQIGGGSIDITSTEGKFVNKTVSLVDGSAKKTTTTFETGRDTTAERVVYVGGEMHTTLGNAGRVEATNAQGQLSITAAGDIQVNGAYLASKGDLSLTTTGKGDVVFDTIEVVNASTTYGNVEDRSNAGHGALTALAGAGAMAATAGVITNIPGLQFATPVAMPVAAVAGLIGGALMNEMQGGYSHTTIATTTNVGSKVDVGGALTINSGRDVAVKGSKITANDLQAEAAGKFEVLAVKDSTTRALDALETNTLQGSLFSQKKTTERDYSSEVVGSHLDIAGSTRIVADSIKVQGSQINSGQGMELMSNKLEVLEDHNENYSFKQETTSELFSFSGGGKAASQSSGSAMGNTQTATSSVDNSVDAQQWQQMAARVNDADPMAFAGTTKFSESKRDLPIGVAEFGASFDATANAQGNVYLFKQQTTTAHTAQTTGVSSALNSSNGAVVLTGRERGGAENTIKVVGSDMTAESLRLEGKSIEVLAGRDVDYKRVEQTTTGVGIFVEADAKAGVKGAAEFRHLLPSMSQEASGQASADGVATLGAQVQYKNRISEDTSIRTSTLKAIGSSNSGVRPSGDILVSAYDEVLFQGAVLDANRNISIDAKNIRNEVATATNFESSVAVTHTHGVYVDGSASASASAADSTGIVVPHAIGQAGARAKADATMGWRSAVSTSSATKEAAVVTGNVFKAGNDVNRNATDTLSDAATTIDASGDINQRAGTIVEREVHDTVTLATESMKTDNRLGAQALATAQARVMAHAGLGAQGGVPAPNPADAKPSANARAYAEANAGLGVNFSSTTTKTWENAEAKSAVVSQYTAGGAIKSQSVGDTILLGSVFNANGDIELMSTDGKVGYYAAQDRQEIMKKSHTGTTDVSIILKGSTGVTGSVGVNLAEGGQKKKSAVTGVMTSQNGSIKMQGAGDVVLQGTRISAAQDVVITSLDGQAALYAAKTEQNGHGWQSNNALGISILGSGGTGGVGGSTMGNPLEVAEGVLGVSTGGHSVTRNSVYEEGVDIKAGGQVRVKAKSDVTLEGSSVDARGISLTSLTGDVNLREALVEEFNREGGAQFGSGTVALPSNQQSGSVRTTVGAGVEAGGKTVAVGLATKLTASGDVTINAAKKINNQSAQISDQDYVASGVESKTPLSNARSEYTTVGVGAYAQADAQTHSLERVTDRSFYPSASSGDKIFNRMEPRTIGRVTLPTLPDLPKRQAPRKTP